MIFSIPDSNKLLTTFVEKSQTKRGTIVTPPRELRKFQDLHILDATCGRHHILIFAALKTTIFTSLDLSDPNDNNSIEEPSPKQILNNNIQQSEPPLSSPKKTPPPLHILTKQNVINNSPILGTESAGVQLSIESDTNCSKASTDTVIEVENPIVVPVSDQKDSLAAQNAEVEPTPSLIEFEELEMDSAFSAVSGVGKMVEHEVKSGVEKMVTDSMKQVDDFKGRTMETIKEAPKEAMKVINNEIVHPVGDKLHELNEKKNEMLNDVVGGVKNKSDSVIHTLESKFHLGDSKDKDDEADDKVLFKKNESLKNHIEKAANMEAQKDIQMITDKMNDELKKDEKIEVMLSNDNGKISSSIKNSDDVTFINDGVDVTNDVAKSMKEELDEMEKSDEMINEMHTKNEDSLLGEKLIGVKPLPSNLLDSKESKFLLNYFVHSNFLIFLNQSLLNMSLDSFTELLKKASIEGTYIPLKGPLKQEMEEIDLDADGERTTASIKSVTPAKNPFESNEDLSLATQVDKMGTKVTSVVRDGEGRVKRFFKEIKNKSNCKNADTALENTDEMDVGKIDPSDYTIDNKTSKVCTIL